MPSYSSIGCLGPGANGGFCGLPRAKLFYTSTREFRKSRHCRDHACYFLESQGSCSRLVATGAHFCKKHIQCRAHNIDGRRCLENVHKKDANTYRYCLRFHKCGVDDCANVRAQTGPGGKNLEYCTSHKCELASCPRLKSDSQKSRWCLQHTCQGDFCTAQVEDTDRFCANHAKCLHDGCDRPVHTRPGETSGQYCSQHYCRWLACERLRVNSQGAGSRTAPAFCEVHLCKMRDCKEPRVGSSSLPSSGIWAGEEADYCSKHECEREGCMAAHDTKTRWCADHQCSEKDCERGRWGDKQWCQRHMRCAESECQQRVMHLRGEPQAYCEEHLSSISPSLESIISTTPHPHRNIPLPCILPSCSLPRDPISPYCPTHQCRFPNCVSISLSGRKSLSLASLASSMGPRCGNSNCRSSKCFPRACEKMFSSVGGACKKPQCRREGLNNYEFLLGVIRDSRRGDNSKSDYCRDHGCGVRGCRGEVDETEEGVPWCKLHRCEVRGCLAEGLSSSSTPGGMTGGSMVREVAVMLCQAHLERVLRGERPELVAGAGAWEEVGLSGRRRRGAGGGGASTVGGDGRWWDWA